MANDWAKTVLVEMASKEFAQDPRASYGQVADRLLERLEMEEENASLLEEVRHAAPRDYLEKIARSVISATRKGMKSDLLSGQQTDEALSGSIPYEAAKRVILTVPVGVGHTTKIRAIDCTREQVEAARQYYAEQKAAIGQRESWCDVLIKAFDAAELSGAATVRDLYKAN